MSRRFGRNQKRRMREELAAKAERVSNLETGMAMDRVLLRKQGDDLSELRHLLGEFTDRVGRYAIAADIPDPRESRNLDLSRMPNFRMPVPQRAAINFSNMTVESTAAFCDEVMSVLDVHPVHESMSHDMHCRLTFDGMPIGYAISRHAVRNLTRDELVRRIVPEIAYFLEAELKKAGWRP
jgi:hypothetical protein